MGDTVIMTETTEIAVRVLGEADWPLYREIRLRGLTESPKSFTATLAEEVDLDERFWRDRMTRSSRLLATRGTYLQGVVSLGIHEQDTALAEIFGLYVLPEARGTGVSWRLVESAATLATQNGRQWLYYWVGTDNGRAVGFAKNFGFRITDERRPTRGTNTQVDGAEEIAMMLPLEPDARSAPNPTADRATTQEGPDR